MATKETSNKRMQIRISQKNYDRLEEMADRYGISPNSMVTFVVGQWLDSVYGLKEKITTEMLQSLMKNDDIQCVYAGKTLDGGATMVGYWPVGTSEALSADADRIPQGAGSHRQEANWNNANVKQYKRLKFKGNKSSKNIYSEVIKWLKLKKLKGQIFKMLNLLKFRWILLGSNMTYLKMR